MTIECQIYKSNLSAALDVEPLADFLDTILTLKVGSQNLKNKLNIIVSVSNRYPFNTLCDVWLAGTLGYSRRDLLCTSRPDNHISFSFEITHLFIPPWGMRHKHH